MRSAELKSRIGFVFLIALVGLASGFGGALVGVSVTDRSASWTTVDECVAAVRGEVGGPLEFASVLGALSPFAPTNYSGLRIACELDAEFAGMSPAMRMVVNEAISHWCDRRDDPAYSTCRTDLLMKLERDRERLERQAAE